MVQEPNYLEALEYVESLKDVAKRNYAMAYLAWMRGEQAGDPPPWAPLSYLAARTISRNLDTYS